MNTMIWHHAVDAMERHAFLTDPQCHALRAATHAQPSRARQGEAES